MSTHEHQEIRNFDYIILLCRKMKKRVSFIKNVMGSSPTRLDKWVSFRVALHCSRCGREVPRWRGTMARGTWLAAVQLAFRVPPHAVDACHAELVAKDVPIVRCTNRPAGLAASHHFLP